MNGQSQYRVQPRPLSGWGRYPVVPSQVQRPEKVAALKALVTDFDAIVLARGLGRSYGDAALLQDGITLLMERLNRMLAFDPQRGLLRCEAGVTLQEILEVFVPRGWFLAVTPGTKFVTVGGAIAFDVHGKNHHQDGSFCHFVDNLDLLLASGEIVRCSRETNADLFWATVGGMGLTGVILEAEFALRPIETAYIRCHNLKALNLDRAMALFEEHEPQYQYSVAWIDCLARGRSLGRSILMFGNHASVEDLPKHQQRQPLQIKSKPKVQVWFDPPGWLLNRWSMGWFNQLFFAKDPRSERHFISDYDSYFYPLDAILSWNRLYGKRGFVQYQFVVPPEASRAALTEILQRSSQQGMGTFLAVLKRFGPQDGWLSFPMPGYTLTMDLPVKPGLWGFLDQVDQIVMAHGGRVYLAKDARLSAAAFAQMYPNLPQWLAVKHRIDPHHCFQSVQSQRLQLHRVDQSQPEVVRP